MNLLDVIHRAQPPVPWSEGDKIPWHEPGFSRRMLREHLSQEHDLASRRSAKIDAHVAWLHDHVLARRPTRILDLGCGPGLYASRLARLGHTCVGIDFGPASIDYAVQTAQREGLDCTYFLQDIRTAEYGTGYGLAMQIFGELNVFRPADARLILTKACGALSAGGILVLEPHTFEEIEREGKAGTSWWSAASGLFSEQPHLGLTENSWDVERSVATIRHYIVDAATGQVTRYASSAQAYTNQKYRDLLIECGFDEVAFYPSLTGSTDESQAWLLAIVARKRSA
jgi:SAM-dependent methyltransferase